MQFKNALMMLVVAFGVGCSELPPKDSEDAPKATYVDVAHRHEPIIEPRVTTEKKIDEANGGRVPLYD